MKIGIGTDFHLGLRQYGLMERENDFYQQYNTMIDVFIQQEVDVVIMGGDIFDQARPSPKAMEAFTTGLQKLIKNDIRVCNIIGNHAMIQNPEFVTADEYIFKVTSGPSNGICLLDWDGTTQTTMLYNKKEKIYGLPYHFNFDLDNFIEKVNQLNEEAKDDEVSILVIHQAFKEFCGFTGESLSIEDIDVSNFDLVVCGHIHERMLTELDNGTIFLQPGSLERSSVAEARDEENNGKGVYIIDTNDLSINGVANSFCRIPCARPFLISDMYINSKEEVDQMKREILDEVKQYDVPPILFLTVHDTSNSFAQITDITKDFKSDFLTVRLSYFDESYEEHELMLGSQDVPTARGVLKLALNPMDEEQAQLGLDLYDALKDGKDVSGLLDKFYQKNYQNEVDIEKLPQDDFSDIEEWLN